MSNVQEHLILRQKWMQALRSGKYKKCIGSYEHKDQHCALGVAIKVTGIDITDLCMTLGNGDKSIGDWIAEVYQIPFKLVHDITKFNDAGLSFELLANYIETQLDKPHD